MEYRDFLASGGLGSQLSRWVVVCDEHRRAVAPATTAQRIRHGGSHVFKPAVQVAMQFQLCCDLLLYANSASQACQRVGRCSGRTVSRSSCPRSQPAGAATLLALMQYPAPASSSITLLLSAYGSMTAQFLATKTVHCICMTIPAQWPRICRPQSLLWARPQHVVPAPWSHPHARC